jgi:hypothetical protein
MRLYVFPSFLLLSVSFFLAGFTSIYIFLLLSFFLSPSRCLLVCLSVCPLFISFPPSDIYFCTENRVLFLESTSVKLLISSFYQALPLFAPECTVCNPGSFSLLILREIPWRFIWSKGKCSTSGKYNTRDWSKRASIIQTPQTFCLNTDLTDNSSRERVTSGSLGIQQSSMTFKLHFIFLWPGDREDTQ